MTHNFKHVHRQRSLTQVFFDQPFQKIRFTAGKQMAMLLKDLWEERWDVGGSEVFECREFQLFVSANFSVMSQLTILTCLPACKYISEAETNS